MENEIEVPWSEHTVIEKSELLDSLSDAGEWRENEIKASSFIVSPSYGTLDYDGFVRFLRDKFIFFALTEEEIKESERPHLEAQQLSDYRDDAKIDGKWGELILSTMVEGFLDIRRFHNLDRRTHLSLFYRLRHLECSDQCIHSIQVK